MKIINLTYCFIVIELKFNKDYINKCYINIRNNTGMQYRRQWNEIYYYIYGHFRRM